MVDRETRSVISQSTRVDRVSKYFKSSKLRGSLREKWAEPIVMGSPFCFVAGFFERRRNELEEWFGHSFEILGIGTFRRRGRVGER